MLFWVHSRYLRSSMTYLTPPLMTWDYDEKIILIWYISASIVYLFKESRSLWNMCRFVTRDLQHKFFQEGTRYEVEKFGMSMAHDLVRYESCLTFWSNLRTWHGNFTKIIGWSSIWFHFLLVSRSFCASIKFLEKCVLVYFCAKKLSKSQLSSLQVPTRYDHVLIHGSHLTNNVLVAVMFNHLKFLIVFISQLLWLNWTTRIWGARYMVQLSLSCEASVPTSEQIRIHEMSCQTSRDICNDLTLELIFTPKWQFSIVKQKFFLVEWEQNRW